MLSSNFGCSEPGYMALGIVDTLLDLLVERNILAKDDVRGILLTAADRLGHESNLMGKRAAQTIRDGMPKSGV